MADCTVEDCTPIGQLQRDLLGWGSGPWGSMPWGGDSETETIHVIGGGVPVVATFSPAQGPVVGGTDFVITGQELSCSAFDDGFGDNAIDPLLWQVVTSGTGAVVEEPYGTFGALKCVSGVTAGSVAGIESVSLRPKKDFYLEIEYSIKNNLLIDRPAQDIVCAGLKAAYDSDNYIQIALVAKATTGKGFIKCEVWKSGTLRHSFEMPVTAASGKLGLMRYYDPVFSDWRAAFWSNQVKVYDCFDAPMCTMSASVFVSNNAATYNVQTWFDKFVSHSVVVFVGPGGSSPASSIIEVSTERIRGKTPATLVAWAGPVTIRVSNGSGNGCEGVCDLFSYVFLDAFAVGRTEPFRPTRKELSISDDPILRNPTPNIGHGLRRQL